MNFDDDSGSSSSGEDLPMFDTVQQDRQRPASSAAATGRYVDPAAEDGSDDDVEDEEHQEYSPRPADGSDDDVEEGIIAEIPSWAQNLQRPGTSSQVGKFSERQDEFTRHLNFTEDPDVEVSPQRARASQPQQRGLPRSGGSDVPFDEEGDNSSHFSEHMENSVGRNRSTTSSSHRNQHHNNGESASPHILEGDDDRGHSLAEEGDGLDDPVSDEDAFPITEAAQWDSYLESGTILDETPFTQVYAIVEEVPAEERDDDADDDDVEPQKADTVTQIFKVFCPPLPDDAIATDFDRVRRLAERLCRSMLKNAEVIASDEELRENIVCNIEEVHCDSQTRIVVQMSSHAPCVTLSDIAAFATVTSEHIRIIATTVVRHLVRLHERGLVHGSLHGGNVLINTTSGSVKFSDGAGLLSCPALAPDFGFVSTHLASHLKDLLPTELDEAVEPNSFLNEIWAAFYEDPYQEAFRDDAVAVAHLVAMLINGYPSRFGLSLRAMVDDVDQHPSPSLLTLSSGGDYFAQRAASAGFTEEFLHSAQSLVDVLVGTESLACDEVLEHPFLISSKQIDADSGDLVQQFAEFLVQIGQEASRSIEFSKANAGSSPMNLRLFRNAMFAANIHAAGSKRKDAVDPSLLDAVVLPDGVSFVGTDTVVVEGSNLNVALLTPLPPSRTMLIIRKVEDASIVILSKFHHVAMRDVCNATIALGPCRVCLLEDIARCPRIAVAAVQAILSRVADVELSLHSADVPMCPDPSTISTVTIVSYGVSYPGLAQDFEDIGLSQESQASLLSYQVPDAVERRAPQELFANVRTGHDYPYLRAMATMGKRLVHCGTLDDLYLFHDEVRDYKIVVQDIRGGSLSASGSHMLISPDSPSRNTRQVFPVIMIVDSVEDVYISDCENLTIVVIGAKGAINISNVRHAKLFLAGAYVMMSDCSHCEVHAFALKGAMIEGCERLVVFPLFASFPGMDEVVQQMAEANDLEGTITGEDNLFLTPRVQVQNNQGVDIHQRPQLHVSLDAPELGACPSEKFSEAHAPKGVKLMKLDFSASLFEGHHLGLEKGALLEKASDVVVLMSHMIDASILRTAAMVCPGRKPALASDPTTNLIISHIHTGVIHIADAVAHLTIVGCTGPLDIVVAAAQQVTVSDCTGITVQVACFAFNASHCRNCHFALHVNTQPKLEQRCEHILFSALNITCVGYEEVLDRASVQQHLNLYDHPVDADSGALEPSLVAPPAVSSTGAAGEAQLSVSSAASARALLESRCFVSPPLPATCVGTAEAPFLEALEDRVEKDQSRPNVYLSVFAALSTIAASPLDDMTNESLLAGAGERRRSGAHSDDINDDDQPQRPSARLGQRHRMGEHYDSSSDDEEDDDVDTSHGNSPHKQAQPQPHDTPADKQSSPVRAPAPFTGSMAAGRDDDTSSSDASDEDGTHRKHADLDDDDANDEDESSDEDEAYSHRGGGNATSPRRHEHHADPVRFDEVSSAERSVEAPIRADSPTHIGLSEEEPVIPSRRGEGSPDTKKKADPLRQDVADFKAFLAGGGDATSPPNRQESSSRYDDDADFESDGIELAVDDDEVDDARSPEHDKQLVQALEKTPSPAKKERKAKLDLGFDDTTSSDDEDERDETGDARPRGIVNRDAALAAMGISNEAASRIGSGKSRIYTDPAAHFDDVLPDATHEDGSAVDISENPMTRLRPSNRTLSSPRKTCDAEAVVPPVTEAASLAPPEEGRVTVDFDASTSSSSAREEEDNSDHHESLDATSPQRDDELLDGEAAPPPLPSPSAHLDVKEDSFEEKATPSTSDASLPGVLANVDSPEDLGVSMVSDRTIIFLDIDGVLVPVSPMSFGGGDIDVTCLKHLKSIVDQCGSFVTVVLTSTWRHDESKKSRLNAAFVQAGIPIVTLGVPNGVPFPTEVTYLKSDPQEQGLIRDRVDEIFAFAEGSATMFPEAFRGGRWLAIDDMNLGLDPRMAGHFLLTDTEEGLTSSNVAQAATIISKFVHFSPSASVNETQAQVNEVLRQVGASFCSTEDLFLPLGIEQTSDYLGSTTTRGRSANGSATHASMLTSISSDEEIRKVSSSSLDDVEKRRVLNVVKEVQSLRRARSDLVDKMGDVTFRVTRALEALKQAKKS